MGQANHGCEGRKRGKEARMKNPRGGDWSGREEGGGGSHGRWCGMIQKGKNGGKDEMMSMSGGDGRSN